MISSFIIGFLRIDKFNLKSYDNELINDIKLSVIIAVRNEENNLIQLISNLKNQKLEKENFEIIFVNDNSIDNSEKIIFNEIRDYSNFKLINQKKYKQGKKLAIATGIEHSTGNYIVTTDADCEHGKDWLKVIFSYCKKHKPTMLIAPVKMKGNSFFQKIQSLEFNSLIGTTIGGVGVRHPFMCNGANLIYEKKAYQKIGNALNNKDVSGDDVFLLHSFKKLSKSKILFLKSTKAIVKTEAEKTLKSLINQRLRWSSKSKLYRDFDTIFIAVLVLMVNVLIPITAIYTIYDIEFLQEFVILFGLKIIPDFILLYLISSFLKNKKLLLFFPIVTLIYPFYIIITGFAGLFTQKITWKNRTTYKTEKYE